MPRANKRAKYSTQKTTSAMHQVASTSISKSTTPLSNDIPGSRPIALDLPLELLIEIISYFKYLIIPTIDLGDSDEASPVNPGDSGEKLLERTDALRALSQTCKEWRNVFYPLLWERMEVVNTHSTSGAWYKVLGQTLIRKSFLVTSHPEVAVHIRVLCISLTRYSYNTVLAALVSAMDAMPNLHTLHIVRTHTQMTTMLKTAFEGKSYPSIRTVILPTTAHHVLRCCPEVRSIICTTPHDPNPIISAMLKSCRKVEKMRNLFPDERGMKRFAKYAPNLHWLEYSVFVSSVSVKLASHFKALSHMAFVTTQPSYEAAIANDLNLTACIKLAREFLSRTPGKKSITVRYDESRSYFWGSLPPAENVVPWAKVIRFVV